MFEVGSSVQPGEVEMTAGATLPFHMLLAKKRGVKDTASAAGFGVFPHFCLLKYL